MKDNIDLDGLDGLDECWLDFGYFLVEEIEKHPPICIMKTLVAATARVLLGMGYSKLQIMKIVGDTVDADIEGDEEYDRD